MSGPARVALCGGGVAALESLIALRGLLEPDTHIDLITPNRRFVYQPLAVTAPFQRSEIPSIELVEIAEEFRAELHVGALARVDGQDRCVELAGGTRLAFDAAIIAVGARRRAWLDGALHFGGADDVNAFAGLLERLEEGGSSRLAFVSPPSLPWTLPLYELALLTASHLAEQGVSGVELVLVTPEADPLAVFGTAASRMLRNSLSDRGIHLKANSTARAPSAQRLELSTGETLVVDEVVALPQLTGPSIEGLPSDEEGFITVDEHCRVSGLDGVCAAGDGTAFPIKQGGIATQQADVAAESVATHLGALSHPSAFEPQLRGLLLTGVAPLYLRTDLAIGASARGDLAANPLWMPPTKIAGLHLGPYMVRRGSFSAPTSLQDRPAPPREPEWMQEIHEQARHLALDLADADAASGDYHSALEWLEVVERVHGMLPSGYVAKRETWRTRAGG